MSNVKQDDVLDTRTIAEHIRELHLAYADTETPEDERDDAMDTLNAYADTLAEFQQVLDRTISEVSDPDGMADDFDHLSYMAGGTMVREDYFPEYAKDLCEQIGDIPANLPEYFVIDWEATSNNLMEDYTEVLHEGVTYLFR